MRDGRIIKYICNTRNNIIYTKNCMEQIYSLFVFLFWFGLFIVFYTYIGYGILLYLLVRIKETIKKEDIRALPVPLPDVTLFIAAYNEEDIIPKKMANCRSLS